MEKAKLSALRSNIQSLSKLVEILDKVDTLRADCPSDEVLDSLNDLEKFAKEKLSLLTIS